MILVRLLATLTIISTRYAHVRWPCWMSVCVDDRKFGDKPCWMSVCPDERAHRGSRGFRRDKPEPSVFHTPGFGGHSHPRYRAMCSCPLALPNRCMHFCASTKRIQPFVKGLSRKKTPFGAVKIKTKWVRRILACCQNSDRPRSRAARRPPKPTSPDRKIWLTSPSPPWHEIAGKPVSAFIGRRGINCRNCCYCHCYCCCCSRCLPSPSLWWKPLCRRADRSG